MIISKPFKPRPQTGVLGKHFSLADTSLVMETMYFYKYWQFSVFYRLGQCDPDERNRLCLIPNWASSCCMYTPVRLFSHGTTVPSGPRPPHCRRFAITLTHTTLGMTPLDERSALHGDLYQKTHNTQQHLQFLTTQAGTPLAVQCSSSRSYCYFHVQTCLYMSELVQTGRL